MYVPLVAIIRIIPDTACAIVYDIIVFGSHVGPIESMSEVVVYLTLAEVSCVWRVTYPSLARHLGQHIQVMPH